MRRSGGAVISLGNAGWIEHAATASVVPDKSCFGPALFVLTDIVLAIIMLVRRNHIEAGERWSSAPGAVAGAV